MRAAIEMALGNVTQSSNNETCLEASGDSQWQASLKEFRKKRYHLLCNNMCMGPARAFPEYFPDEFDFDAFERRIQKHKKKKANKCNVRCRNDRVPVAFDLGLNCEFTTHIPLGYAPTYLKSHEKYCGCREDLCPNKRSVASHEPCK